MIMMIVFLIIIIMIWSMINAITVTKMMVTMIVND